VVEERLGRGQERHLARSRHASRPRFSEPVVGREKAARRDEGTTCGARAQSASDLDAFAGPRLPRDAQDGEKAAQGAAQLGDGEPRFFAGEILVRGGEKAAEVTVPVLVCDQEDHPRRLHGELGPDDVPVRQLLGRFVRAHRSVKPVSIGHRDREVPERLGAFDHLFGTRRSLEQREVRLRAELGVSRLQATGFRLRVSRSSHARTFGR
jgi:hypothetical protein